MECWSKGHLLVNCATAGVVNLCYIAAGGKEVLNNSGVAVGCGVKQRSPAHTTGYCIEQGTHTEAPQEKWSKEPTSQTCPGYQFPGLHHTTPAALLELPVAQTLPLHEQDCSGPVVCGPAR